MRGILATLMLTGAIAILVMGARPLWQNIQELKTEKDAFGSAITRINELRKVRDDLVQTYNSIPQADIKRVKKILPDTFSSGLILVELSNLASENGLLLKSTDLSAAGSRTGAPVVKDAAQRYTEVQLKLVVSGPYERFRAFLEKLEKSLRLVDVTSLSFSGGQSGSSVDFSVEGKSYQQP